MPTLADLERTWISARYLEQYVSGNPQFLTNEDMWLQWLQKVAPTAVGTRIDLQKAYAVAQGGASPGTVMDSWLSFMKNKVGGNPVGSYADIARQFYQTSWATIPPDSIADIPNAGVVANWTATRGAIAYSTVQSFTAPGSILMTVSSIAADPWVNLSSGSRVAKQGATSCQVSFMVYPNQDLRLFRAALITYDSGGTLYTTLVGTFAALPVGVWTLVTGTFSVSDPTIVTLAAKIEQSNGAPSTATDTWYFDHMVMHFS